MPMPLQVLLVEDNPMDAGLAIHHLEKAGFKVSSQRIETSKAMRDALSKIEWDIIISDYSLPSFDAPSALRILIESGKDIPFIVVSGTITEETAIDLMRAGAADYLMKDRLARLGPLVKRELNIAQVRKERNETQAQLQMSRDWSNLIYNATSDAMFLVEIEPSEVYRYVTVNAAYLRVTELTEDQVIGKRVEDVFSPQGASFILGNYREAIQAGHAIQYEETIAFPTGTMVVDTILTPIFDQAKVCKHLLGSSHEITSRKRAEALQRESEERFRQFVERSNDAFFRQNLISAKFEYISPTAVAVIGYTPEEITSWNIDAQTAIIHPDDLPDLLHFRDDLIAADTKGENHIEREFRLIDKQGEYQWIHGNFSLVRNDEHQPEVVIGSLSNITKRKQAEKELMDEELYLRTILQTAKDGFLMLDSNGKVIDANRAYVDMSGYPLDELKQMRIEDLDIADALNIIMDRFQRVVKNGADQFETRHRRKDGSIFDVEISATYLTEAGGRFICFCRDITERKQVEMDLENRLIALTRPLDQAEAINFKDLFDISAIQRLQDEFSTATGVASIITYPDGTPITQPSNFCRLCKDIIRKTELGQINCFKSDAALGCQHSDGPIIQPCMSGGLWDAGAGISVGGRHVANWLIGQVRDETTSEEKIREYARQIGADEATVVEAFSEVPSMSQTQFKHVAQALFTMADQLSTIAYQNTQQARFITEQRRVEEELQRWVQAFQNAEWGIAVASADGRVIELMNSAFAKMHGYTVEEMQGFLIADLFAPECRGDLVKNIQLAHQKGHHIWESRHIHKDGHTFPVSLDVTAVKDEKGQPKYRVINTQDITERKRIEENLRASEEKFSNVFRVSPDSININRLDDGTYVEINKGFTTLSGYTEEEVLGKTSLEINIWGNPQDHQRMLQGLREKGVVNNLEALFRAKDGTLKICLMSAQLMEIKGEKCVLSIARDITERKQKDEDYTSFIRTSIDGFSSIDIDGHYLDVNEAYCQMVGYSREELLSMRISDLQVGEDPESMAEHLQKIVKTGSDHFQTLHQRKDGMLIYLEVSSQYVALGNRIYAFVHDISERKQAEAEALKSKATLDRQNSLLNTLLETLPIGVFMVEAPTGKPLVANRTACQLLGRGVLPDASRENIGEVYEAYKMETGLRYPPEEMPILLGMEGISAHIDNMLVVRPDKTTTLLEVTGSPVINADGKIWASLVSFQDITERKQAEKKLNDQLQELRRWHAVTLGREKRILELKSEVNKLLQNAGLPVRYASALESSEE